MCVSRWTLPNSPRRPKRSGSSGCSSMSRPSDGERTMSDPLHVLIVEDSETDAKLIAKELRRVHTAKLLGDQLGVGLRVFDDQHVQRVTHRTFAVAGATH